MLKNFDTIIIYYNSFLLAKKKESCLLLILNHTLGNNGYFVKNFNFLIFFFLNSSILDCFFNTIVVNLDDFFNFSEVDGFYGAAAIIYALYELLKRLLGRLFRGAAPTASNSTVSAKTSKGNNTLFTQYSQFLNLSHPLYLELIILVMNYYKMKPDLELIKENLGCILRPPSIENLTYSTKHLEIIKLIAGSYKMKPDLELIAGSIGCILRPSSIEGLIPKKGCGSSEWEEAKAAIIFILLSGRNKEINNSLKLSDPIKQKNNEEKSKKKNSSESGSSKEKAASKTNTPSSTTTQKEKEIDDLLIRTDSEGNKFLVTEEWCKEKYGISLETYIDYKKQCNEIEKFLGRESNFWIGLENKHALERKRLLDKKIKEAFESSRGTLFTDFEIIKEELRNRVEKLKLLEKKNRLQADINGRFRLATDFIIDTKDNFDFFEQKKSISDLVDYKKLNEKQLIEIAEDLAKYGIYINSIDDLSNIIRRAPQEYLIQNDDFFEQNLITEEDKEKALWMFAGAAAGAFASGVLWWVILYYTWPKD